jgi:hypothetical protein
MMESNIESVMEEKRVKMYEDTHYFVITFHSHRRGPDGESACMPFSARAALPEPKQDVSFSIDDP